MSGLDGLAGFFPGLGSGGIGVLLAVAALLVGGTGARGRALRRDPEDEEVREEWRSLGTWWVLFALLVVILFLGRWGVVAGMAVLFALILREARALTGSKTTALLTAGIGPSFAAAVVFLPSLGIPPDGFTSPSDGPAWFLVLVLLTEVNDITQKWWGSALGSRPLAPVLSPFKTLEGFAGGVATTAVVAVVVAPLLTPYGRIPPDLALPAPAWVWSLGLGVVLALAGTAGDLAASALKRGAGVKDSGTLLPGHGGVLDRFDSLNGTAPVFFFASWLLWFPST